MNQELNDCAADMGHDRKPPTCSCGGVVHFALPLKWHFLFHSVPASLFHIFSIAYAELNLLYN
jgi:hypothetical protein